MHRASAGPARIVLDANILVSAVIASGRESGSELGGTVDRALGGEVTVITCPRLLTEVERALRSPRLARWVDADQVLGAMEWSTESLSLDVYNMYDLTHLVGGSMLRR